MPGDASRLRQRLREIEEKRARQLDLALGEPRALIRGTVGVRRRVCGTPNCRCTRGELHESKYLSATVDGQTRQVHVPAGDEVAIAEGTARYQRWHEVRTSIAKLGAEQLELLDALGRALLKPYPPDDPIPPARRRGRRPRGASDDET